MSASYKIILFFGLLITNFCLFNFVYAQTIPGGVAITANEIIDLMQSIGGFLIVVGTVATGIVIVYSGISYILAGSNSTKVKGAKDALMAGLIGGAIIFGVGVIIKTITDFAGNPLGFFK